MLKDVEMLRDLFKNGKFRFINKYRYKCPDLTFCQINQIRDPRTKTGSKFTGGPRMPKSNSLFLKLTTCLTQSGLSYANTVH